VGRKTLTRLIGRSLYSSDQSYALFQTLILAFFGASVLMDSIVT